MLTRQRRGDRPRGGILAVGPGAALFIAIFVLPALWLLATSVLTAERFGSSLPLTLDGFRDIFESPLTWTFVKNALYIGFPTAAVTVAAAIPVAYWLRFAARRARIPVIFLLIATLFASYLVRIYAWRTLLGQNGIINVGLQEVGLIDEPLGFLLFSRFATVIGLTHLFLPIVVMLLLGAFQPLESGYLEVGRDLGASGLTVWRRVVLPILAQPILGAFMLILIIASSDWATATFLGGGRDTLIGQEILRTFQQAGNYPRGAAYTILLLAVLAASFGIIAAGLRLAGLNNLRMGDAAPGPPRPAPLAGAWTAITLVFLWVPLMLVILFSFHRTAGLSLPFEGFSLRWYRTLFDDGIASEAFFRSLRMAALVTAITAVVGTLAAFGLTRIRPLARTTLTGAFLAPIALPPIFVGAALLTYVAALGYTLSTRTIFMGHLVMTLPLFLLMLKTALDRLDPALDEVSADLGARPFQVLTRSTLPQIWPTIVGASALTFAVSFDEFPVTVFLSGPEMTLPLYIYARARKTIDPTINAVSTLLLGVMMLLCVIGALMVLAAQRRRSDQTNPLANPA